MRISDSVFPKVYICMSGKWNFHKDTKPQCWITRLECAPSLMDHQRPAAIELFECLLSIGAETLEWRVSLLAFGLKISSTIFGNFRAKYPPVRRGSLDGKLFYFLHSTLSTINFNIRKLKIFYFILNENFALSGPSKPPGNAAIATAQTSFWPKTSNNLSDHPILGSKNCLNLLNFFIYCWESPPATDSRQTVYRRRDTL